MTLGAETGSLFSIDDDVVVVGIGCVNTDDDGLFGPPPSPATPPPLAPMSPPLSNPTVFPQAVTLANTVLDTAEAVIAATGDVLCGILDRTAADDCVTAAAVCP